MDEAIVRQSRQPGTEPGTRFPIDECREWFVHQILDRTPQEAGREVVGFEDAARSRRQEIDRAGAPDAIRR